VSGVSLMSVRSTVSESAVFVNENGVEE